MDLSFSGAGFMGCYYFGVVNCWDRYIPRERVRRVAGASAGSLIAAYYLMDLPLHKCLKEIIEITEDARKRPLGVFDRSNQIVDVLPRALDKMFPEDAHKRVNGRLYVCMTRLKDLKSVVVNEFETRQDLIDALNCSCFIPVWSGNHVSTYKGVKYIDGGFTNNMPVFDEHTVRVCCFAGGSDIAPYDKARIDAMKASLQGMSVNLTWKNFRRGARALWPPPASFIIQLLERGFHDTKEFILSNDLIQCDRCFKATERELQPIYSRITPTISPAASPNVSRAPSFLNLSDLHRGTSSGGSFKLRLSKRRSKTSKSPTSKQTDDENWQPPALPPVRIKEHRRQPVSGFETNRDKSGKRIPRKALERLRLEAEENQLQEQQRSQGLPNNHQSGFAQKLREKLQKVAAAKSATPEKPPKGNNNEYTTTTGQPQEAPMMPTIVVDEPAIQSQATELEAEIKPAEEQESPVSILDAMDSRNEETSRKESQVAQVKLRTGSLSSSASSNDSAVVLETPGSVGVMFGSPAEKFLAGSKQRTQSISLANGASSLLTPTSDRFSSAPSPLPSCPPSPNLNRHCTECIRLRQQARTDGLDESIREAAQLYSSVKSREPEREFNSIKWKLACWLRQIGTPKYSYSFKDELNHGASTEDLGAADMGAAEEAAAGETMAERKAKRKASHPLAWPPSEIQASS